MNGDMTVRVLLVEDNIVDVEAVRRAFKKHHIENPIVVARDGIAALARLRGTDGAPPLPRPFVILLDINLPRMNGLEFLEALRADPELRDAVVFVLTTSDSASDIARSYRYNVAGYIQKDSVGEDFIRLVELLGSYWSIVRLLVRRPT